MDKLKFEFMRDGRPLDPQGWRVSHDYARSTAMAPIYCNGGVVALVVIGEDGAIGGLASMGQTMAERANAHGPLVTALRAAQHRLNELRPHYDGIMGSRIDKDLQGITAALAKAGVV